MAWLVLIIHQTQPEKKMLRYAKPISILPGKGSKSAFPCAAGAIRPYLAASFCVAICPAAPSLSASFTLAHSARAMSCLPSET